MTDVPAPYQADETVQSVFPEAGMLAGRLSFWKSMLSGTLVEPPSYTRTEASIRNDADESLPSADVMKNLLVTESELVDWNVSEAHSGFIEI